MIRLKDTRHPNTSGFLGSAIRIAEYYGFTPIDKLQRVRLQAPSSKREPEMSFARRDERSLMLSAKLCISAARNQNDVLLIWRLNKNAARDRSNIPCHTIELHIVGAPHAMAEALLIVVADAIAADAGISRRVLSINSIGSVDSSNRFVRDIGTFLRKHIDSISPTLRPRAATDPLGTLTQLFERGHPATPRAPQSMEYLTEDERKRFWDLLEYLEVFGVPYELSPSVLGSRDFWAHTLFEMASVDEETGSRIPFASGGRYDPLASRFAARETPAVVVSIACELRGKTRVKPAVRMAPSLYFAHLGMEARRKALSVLETLRHAGIPVHQSLMYERLGEQMEHAKKTSVSHLLLMGHKEAMEGTVLVREVATNSQEAVALTELPGYLRRYKSIAATSLV
ncbi:MAG: histidyl-tRNA synthetase [Parcubacteria group bacterium Gr01-1014_8]|nr:MAG: histidyl-tRNA synthetase [Parcubacteria group bacterium Gr01-1014_8]